MSAAHWLKALQLLGVVLTAGGPAFLTLIWRPALASTGLAVAVQAADTALGQRVRWLTAAGAITVAVTGTAELVRLGAALAGPGPSLWQVLGQALRIATETSVGGWLAVRILLAAALVIAREPRCLWRVLVIALLATFPLTSHATTHATARVWLYAADLVHLSATALWYGGILHLTLLPWRALQGPVADTVLARLVHRFSSLGLVAMLSLSLTGGAMAAARLYGLLALAEHPYGQTLAVKLAFLSGVLAMAAANLLLVRPMLSRGRRLASRLLRGLVAGEAALGLAVLGAAAVLSTSPPPRGEPVRLALSVAGPVGTPTELKAPKGRPVLLTVANGSAEAKRCSMPALPHDMIGRPHGTDEMGLYLDVGRSRSLLFVVRHPGRYPFYCARDGEAAEAGVLIIR